MYIYVYFKAKLFKVVFRCLDTLSYLGRLIRIKLYIYFKLRTRKVIFEIFKCETFIKQGLHTPRLFVRRHIEWILRCTLSPVQVQKLADFDLSLCTTIMDWFFFRICFLRFLNGLRSDIIFLCLFTPSLSWREEQPIFLFSFSSNLSLSSDSLARLSSLAAPFSILNRLAGLPKLWSSAVRFLKIKEVLLQKHELHFNLACLYPWDREKWKQSNAFNFASYCCRPFDISSFD